MNHYPKSYSNRRQRSPSSRNKFASNFNIHKFHVFGDSLAVMLWQGENINDREVQERDYIGGCDISRHLEDLISELKRTEGGVPHRILLAIGYNESTSIHFDPSKLFCHIERVIDLMMERGCRHLVLTNIPPSPRINTRTRIFRKLGADPNSKVLQYWRNLQQVNQKIQYLAQQRDNVHVCDVFNTFCYPISGNRDDDYVIGDRVNYVVESGKFVSLKPNERPHIGEQHLITREGKTDLFEHVRTTLNHLECVIFLEKENKRKKKQIQDKGAAATADAPSETRWEDCFTLNDEEDAKSDQEKKDDDSNNVTNDAEASKSRSASIRIANFPSKMSPNRSRGSSTVSPRWKTTSKGGQCSTHKSRSRRRSSFRNSSPRRRFPSRKSSSRRRRSTSSTPRRRSPSGCSTSQRRHRTSRRTSFNSSRKSRSMSRVHSRTSSSNMKFTGRDHSLNSGSSSHPVRHSSSAHSRLSRSQSPLFRQSSQSQSPLSRRSPSQSWRERSTSHLEFNVPPSQSPLNDDEGSEMRPPPNLSHTSDIVCVEDDDDDDDQLCNGVSDDLNQSGKELEGDIVPPTDSNASTAPGKLRGIPLVLCDFLCTCPKCIYSLEEFIAGFTEAVDELCGK